MNCTVRRGRKAAKGVLPKTPAKLIKLQLNLLIYLLMSLIGRAVTRVGPTPVQLELDLSQLPFLQLEFSSCILCTQLSMGTYYGPPNALIKMLFIKSIRKSSLLTRYLVYFSHKTNGYAPNRKNMIVFITFSSLPLLQPFPVSRRPFLAIF